MCGIALIVSGVRIDLSSLLFNSVEAAPPSEAEQPIFSVDDFKEALRKRGPDSLGTQKVLLHSSTSSSDNGSDSSTVDSVGELDFVGSVLQLRGVSPIAQPLVDASGNILVYNGEIFGGICVGPDSNDGEVLMQCLGRCSSGDSSGLNSISHVLSEIKGPWAIIYWQNSSRTLWFGRDAFGRRSLLVHWPNVEDSRLLLSSVAPPCSVEPNSGDDGISNQKFWEELSCGIYCVSMGSSSLGGCSVGKLERHEWTNPLLSELIKWERTSIQPGHEDLYCSHTSNIGEQNDMFSAYSDRISSKSGHIGASDLVLAQTVLVALMESVKRRSSLYTIFQAVSSEVSREENAPVAVLFSGGLDSMILAALLDQCLDPIYDIDLLNVSFDGSSAPDRISSRAGVNELNKIAPKRRWKLVEIDADLSNLTSEMKHVISLINPANTYMDLNIGIALWLAAGGDGWLYEGSNPNNNENHRVKYKSKSRIVLVGAGADEQCAGYGRHRTKYRHGSWLELNEEMKLDMQRIWKRNLGRDDRCIADNGKEARFPFLDEDVIRMLLSIPLWEVANLDQPSGTGDKKILREVAKLLGLNEAAVLPKRAIQFGSRIARESNRKNFGSNRAANQASAGSVVFQMPP